jgi:hypothetical protein
MTLLDNPQENPCFGCGPQHPRGLRLQFRREGDAVLTTHTPREDEIGWPGLYHTGLHYSTLFEASYWAALELTGKVQNVTGPQTFDQKRLPRVGKPFTVTARIVSREPLLVRAEAATEDGKPTATLETTWTPASRAAVERAGLKLPDYLMEDMAP